MDAFNAVWSTTYEIDKEYSTHYHENFKNYLRMVQDNDYTVDGAMTDQRATEAWPLMLSLIWICISGWWSGVRMES